MTEYRAGQRVRIEWADGHVIEGPVQVHGMTGTPFVRCPPGLNKFWLDRDYSNPTITILSEPRPDEPTGLGAVVEAGFKSRYAEHSRRLWVRRPVRSAEEGSTAPWIAMDAKLAAHWDHLTDPVVLGPGFHPTEFCSRNTSEPCDCRRCSR